jgi:tripartite-type tricarboxylate transporter receptor subunit TctC
MSVMRFPRTLLAAASIMLAASAVRAEWPDKPIQLVVPFPAGGTVDVVSRRFAEGMSQRLKQPLVVVNRDGGSGIIGAAAVSISSPDGYTLGFFPDGPISVQPTLNRRISYSADSFKPVCQVFSFPYVLAVKTDSALNTLRDFAAKAKAAPQEVTYGFGGIGTAPHFAMLQFAQKSGLKFLGVPFRGDPAVAVGLKGGEVDAAVLTVETARRLGFKVLAVFADQRLPMLPKALTAREQGFDVVASTYTGLFAPVKTPANVTAKLEAACASTLKSDDFQRAMIGLNQSASWLDSEKFESALRADIEIKRRLIESSGIRQE